MRRKFETLEAVCQRCNKRITHGGSARLEKALQWWDVSDEFMCPDGVEQHRPPLRAELVKFAHIVSAYEGRGLSVERIEQIVDGAIAEESQD